MAYPVHPVQLERRGEPGERGYDYADLLKSNWKQCVWKRNDGKDSGLIQVGLNQSQFLFNATIELMFADKYVFGPF